MYIDQLTLINVRTFVKNELCLLHPDSTFRSPKDDPDGDESLLPKPKLPNVNLLLGDNGSGKTTVLQAIALASLGPAARESQLPLRKYVRFPSGKAKSARPPAPTTITASLRLHAQDGLGQESAESVLRFKPLRELERLEFDDSTHESSFWEPVFESQNDAFFCAAYGATRRVDAGESPERGAAPKTSFLRGQRLQSIFQESFALFPLAYWLPQLKSTNKGRYSQVVDLLNRLLGPGHYRFTEEMREGEYLYERAGMRIPFRSLSDGYRAFIAWVADLLYHVCYGCPAGKRLVESAGVVLVDEIDLHLHPKWQMHVVNTVARALPRMQFVLTSHSPLIAGSLEWMNIITLQLQNRSNRTHTDRLKQSIHGLDADQMLLTDFFGLKTTRAAGKVAELHELQQRARHGDKEAADRIILAMAQGTEASQ
jgi:hypothetical protein